MGVAVGVGVGAVVGVGVGASVGDGVGAVVGAIGLGERIATTADDGAGLPVIAATLPGAIEAVGTLSPPRTRRKPTDAAAAATRISADAITADDGPR